MKNILKSRYYISDIVLGTVFFFMPFWSLPLLVFQFIKTRRIFYTILISMFFALTASLLAPTGDLYRLYLTYFDFQNYDFDSFINFLSAKPDFLFYALLYVFAKIGLSIRIIIFLMIFSFFQLSFNLLLKQPRKISVLIILLFVMQFDFLLQGLFLRFPLAILLVIYAFLNKIQGKNYSLLLLIIASTIHFGALISIPIYFLSRLSLKKLNTALLISLLIIPFGSYLFIFLTNNLLEWFPNIPFKEKLEDYFLGYWALEYFEERTWKALFQIYIERVLYFLVLAYFLLTKGNTMHRKIAIPFLILINVLFTFPNLFNRYFVLATFFGILCIIIEHKKTAYSQLIRLGLALTITLVFSTRIVAQQKNIRVGYIPAIIYNNVISLSLKKYDIEWINKHIDKKSASPKKVKSL